VHAGCGRTADAEDANSLVGEAARQAVRQHAAALAALHHLRARKAGVNALPTRIAPQALAAAVTHHEGRQRRHLLLHWQRRREQRQEGAPISRRAGGTAQKLRASSRLRVAGARAQHGSQ
jgi:hypothetical protein